MNKKLRKAIHWAPRILSIVFVLFLMMFSLDIFDGNYGFWGTILGLFMHNIPAFIILAVAIVAWKRPMVGAIGFILAGFAYIAVLVTGIFKGGFEWYMLSWMLIISGPAFLTGMLFLLDNQLSKN